MTSYEAHINDMFLTRSQQVGSGTYGSVHLGEDDHGKGFAVKINAVESTTSYIAGIKEADILLQLKGHPSIVNLVRADVTTPFINHPTIQPAEGEDTREDRLYLTFEYLPMALDKLIRTRNSNIDVREFLRQMLLGIEYMHGKKIYHRDLKPANILIEGSRCVLCDFGMSKEIRDGSLSPRVTTCWYRAPEICAGIGYSSKADLWAIGLIALEMITRTPLLSGYTDDNDKILTKILTVFSYQDRGLYRSNMLPLRGSINDLLPRNHSMSDLIPLLDGLLQVDPSKRISSTQALGYQCFNSQRHIIDSVRVQYPPVDVVPLHMNIPIGPKRDIGIRVAYELFNDRYLRCRVPAYKDRWWYSHRILFMGISIFDRYLIYLEDKDIETTQLDIELRFLVCLYISIKYNMSTTAPPPFDNILPKIYGEETYIKAERIEEEILVEVLQFRVSSRNLYEIAYSKGNLTSDRLKSLLEYYGRIDTRDNLTTDLVDAWLSRNP